MRVGSSTKRHLFRLALTVLSGMRVDRLLSPLFSGIGVIFSLHGLARRADAHSAFEGYSSVEFLEESLDHLMSIGCEVISLDEMHRRLTAPAHTHSSPFACFTFDDGYRDNLDLAYPVFRKRSLPFAIYVATDFIDRKAFLWTYALREIILSADRISFELGGRDWHIPCDTGQKKRAAYASIKRSIVRASGSFPEETFMRSFRNALDPNALRARLEQAFLSWNELRQLVLDPLVTIGSHSVRHLPLSRLSVTDVERELEGSRKRIGRELQKTPLHFAYPFGSIVEVGVRELEIAKRSGYLTMVTTRFGNIFPEHAAHLEALPRIPFNAAFEGARALDVLLSGAPSALANRLRKLPAL